MGLTEKKPQYQACVKFISTFSPKNTKNQTDVVYLTSPTEDKQSTTTTTIFYLERTKTNRKKVRRKRKTKNCRKTRNMRTIERTPTEMENNQKCEDYIIQNPKKPTGTLKLKLSKHSFKISC